MRDDLLLERLELVLECLEAIESYVESIKKYKDFQEVHGQLIYDAVLMRLQVVGENVKKIYRKAPTVLPLTEEEIFFHNPL